MTIRKDFHDARFRLYVKKQLSSNRVCWTQLYADFATIPTSIDLNKTILFISCKIGASGLAG
jgi:hypothetical protein